MIQRLLESQAGLLARPTASAASRAAVATLATEVPAPVLRHFLQFITSGRRGVSLVKHGVCSECHIRVCSGVVAALAKPHDLHLCEHCGRYLLLPEDEIPEPGSGRVLTARR